MFFSESRYLKVKEYTVQERAGRNVAVKRTRADAETLQAAFSTR